MAQGSAGPVAGAAGMPPAGSGSASAASVSTGSPAGSGGSSILVSPQQVTLADNGKTISMRVGDTFTLALGDQPWNVAVADQTVLRRLPNFAMVRGAQGIYRAYAAGTTTLSATFTPACAQAHPACMIASMLFRVTVDVH
jgi:predicted secreted protein